MKPLVTLALVFMLFLTGCVRYDVGINFQDQRHGEIIQNINLAPQLTRLSQKEVEQWIDSLKQKAENLQGRVQHLSPENIKVTIPFGNGKDLASKFNQLFHQGSKKQQSDSSDDLDLVNLDAQMSINQLNLILVERNLIDFKVDLRGLGIVSQEGDIIISSGSLFDLSLSIDNPIKTKEIQDNSKSTQERNLLTWHLQPGQINQLKVICWVPSQLGIGTLGIILLFFIGYYLKYKNIPGRAKSIPL